ncbi:MAG: toxin-antitoxin system HicB family antitoxin [Prochloron sp. SP5CPC1]|nr:toxin-antitoxin system HicB family antitoxin [Candidatus Paraprochloron terpiosi SP5CPC1]
MNKTRGTSLNKLMEEFSNMALAEFDAHTRFKALAVVGDPNKGLMLLDKLDEHWTQKC